MAEDHEHWMRLALAEAEKAFALDEAPIGAVIVANGRVIATGFNEKELRGDPTAHAEILAIQRAAISRVDWRLDDCTLYATLEPCPMCAGAAVQARIATIVYGATDPKAGACGTLYRLTEDPRLNHRCTPVGGVLAGPCGEILTRFFAARRAEGKK